ncbi:MAG: tRNA (N6-threonylcarbamoyladenosine(37)-N6)-methyltransferase TrmO [candidate division KSB1 bacterium]|nr:tRNA (N6-threonylcarbamoyladenosine(37)-N6)-methyltransferase TrmO [candidate division KSB1 bacterium]
MSDPILFEPIGIIHSPHTEPAQVPIQPVFCGNIRASVHLDPHYADGLLHLDGFSHIYLFYWFHRSAKTALQLTPYLMDKLVGIFATRAPHRPNKLGMSLVQLLQIEDNVLHIQGVDILDGTPLLDIKPYIKRFDQREQVRSGWQEGVDDDEAASRGNRDYKSD